MSPWSSQVRTPQKLHGSLESSVMVLGLRGAFVVRDGGLRFQGWVEKCRFKEGLRGSA